MLLGVVEDRVYCRFWESVARGRNRDFWESPEPDQTELGRVPDMATVLCN